MTDQGTEPDLTRLHPQVKHTDHIHKWALSQVPLEPLDQFQQSLEPFQVTFETRNSEKYFKRVVTHSLIWEECYQVSADHQSEQHR